MKKKILILLTLASIFIGAEKVFAGTNDSAFSKEVYDGAYAVADLPDRKHLYYAERFMMNGKTTYCIELGMAVNTHTYSSTTNSGITGLSNDVLNYVKLVAFYGYDYPSHKSRNYYLAAQELIWEKISGRSVHWVTDLDINSSELNISSEKNEIINLVNNHNKVPSFDGQTIEVNIDESKTISDTNRVLSEYEIKTANNNVAKSGNNITVKGTNNMSTNQITFTKSGYLNNEVLIYYTSSNDQKMISAGRVDMPSATVKISTVGGTVSFKKLDKQTNDNPQGEATLNGAIYGVYKSDGTLVDRLTNGTKNTSKDLAYGNYYLQEIEASNGYQLDKTKYEFIINSNNNKPSLDVYEEVINRDIELVKVYANEKTGIMKPESNITFGFYDTNDNLYKQETTDENGRIKTNLVYGTYTVKQINTTTNYERVKDFKITVTEMGETFYYTIANAEISAKLKVVKIDKETKEVIKRSNIKFKIFNTDTNKYVSQTITYPKARTIDVFETDDNGVIITPYPLKSGNYKLVEVKEQQVDGYVWNKESLEFSIDENSKFVEDSEYGALLVVEFENTRVKGSVVINKSGEQVELTDNGYVYTKIKLADVKIGLYANENIYDGTGNLIYKKGTLVKELITDDNGMASIDNLYLGKYFLKEIETVDNHVLDTNKYEFELKYVDQYTEKVEYDKELINYLPSGKLVFTKIDISTSEPLPNTLIEIYNSNNELVYRGNTNEKGQIIIDRLPIGKYYILEKEAPDGYLLNEEKMWFEIQENDQIVKSTMSDDRIKVEVPNTYAIENIVSDVIVGAIFLIGLGILLYAKRKINNKK